MAGGGVGEAMLIGAAVGAGTGAVSSAVQKKDVLQGALLGGAMGAAGGGIGSGIGGMASEMTTPALEGAALDTAATPAVESAITTPTTGAADTGFGSSFGDVSKAQFPSGSQAFGSTGSAEVGPNTFVNQAYSQASPNWGSQGLGQGFAPGLTNAQAYGAGAGGGIMGLVGQQSQNRNNMAPAPSPYTGPLSKFTYDPNQFRPSVAPGYAEGGITSLAAGGVQQTGMFPQSQMDKTQFATPSQMPISREIIGSDYDTTIDPYTGDLPRFAAGGISDLGGYSDGGRLLRGPGDGMSDSIPASIGRKQPARLADGEFVVPADVVSGIGNGSTDAGAKKLYGMMDNIRKARTGTKKQGKDIKAEKYIPGMASGGEVKHYAGGNLVMNDGQVGYYQTNEDGETSTFVPLNQGLNQVQGSTTVPGQGAVSAGFQPTGYAPSNYIPLNTDWYLQQNPDVAAHEYYSKHPLEHYIDWGIKEGRAGQPEGSTQPSIYYNPYTLANRPSASKPQFYGNIYQPTYENYAGPSYDLNAGLGRWSNAAPKFDEQLYLQQKMQQLQDAGYKGEFTGKTGAALKDYMASQGMTPQLHYQMYGKDEGLSPYANAPAAPSLAADIAAMTPIKETPKTEQITVDNKRRGGIASLVRR